MRTAIQQNSLFYGDNLPILREYVADERVERRFGRGTMIQENRLLKREAKIVTCLPKHGGAVALVLEEPGQDELVSAGPFHWSGTRIPILLEKPGFFRKPGF